MLIVFTPVIMYAQLENYSYLQNYRPTYASLESKVDIDPFQLEVVKKLRIDRPIKGQEELRNKVIQAIGADNIEGVVHGRGSVISKVLIKGWIFSPIDEITFPQTGGRTSPLAGKTIMLLDILKDSILVRISSEEDTEATEFNINFDSFYH